MGLKDLFAKASVPDKEPVLRDRSTILAYLEEVCRLRTCVMLWLGRDDLMPMGGKVELVGEETDSLTLCLQRSLPADLDPRFPIEMMFPMDGMRFRCPIRFKERGGYMQAVFKLPECVYHAERRNSMRTRFSQRENASITVLESLFRGHGASGRLVNLSMEGICMRLEKAISIHEDKRLSIHAGLFQPRQELMVVRILDLPHAPLVECGGTVMHLETGPEGVTMGLHLEGLGTLESQAICQVLTRRIPAFGRGFPQKRRRCEIELQPEDPGPEPACEEPLAEEPAPESPTPAEEPLPQADRLERMRKRTRRILILQLDDLDRAILGGTLLADGFTQVKEARNFAEAVQILRSAPADIIFIEQQLGSIPAQQFLSHLRKACHCDDVPVILLADLPDVKTSIMAKAMHIAHVQKRPVDYEGELRAILYGLLRISKE